MFNKTTTRLLATSVLIAVCSPAIAADMPGRRNAQPVYKSAVPPAFTWTGFYAGATGGMVWGDFNKGGKYLNPKTGFSGGLTGGYNYQFGNYVAGLEGDYNYSGMSGLAPFPGSVLPVKGALTRYGTARARLGMTFDRALVYATGGYAFGYSSIYNGTVKPNDTHHGYVVGVGLEYAFTQNVSLKTEYLYMPLGTGKNYTGVPNLLTAPKTGIDANVIRAGVNYRF